ncbi:MAG: DNA replication/repair protein RecF [Cyclobacteriaceae bacterium]|nr:DNA replication/repair protein RecF [Cyclobacteriaceae bacterium]
MFLNSLRLFNFKNHAEVNLTFDSSVNCIVGRNGSGKTNVLDAIYYLSFSKSAFNPSDGQNIKHREPGFFLRGNFTVKGKQREVECAVQTTDKKVLREDGQDYKRFSEHLGKYPVVLIAPQDIGLIWDGAEPRRKFVDAILSQVDRIYLEHLITYTHQLKQRNSLLRNFSESGHVDVHLLESYNVRLVESGEYIHRARQCFCEELAERVKQHYGYLAEGAPEEAGITYKSDLEVSFAQLLKGSVQRDLVLQRTSVGVHRDDFVFTLNGYEIRRVGSQGQQKSFLIALKLAEFEVIKAKMGLKPILLLDDIFDKLDDYRISRLVTRVAEGAFGQLFITDARPDRTRSILTAAGIKARIFTIENGTFTSAWLQT